MTKIICPWRTCIYNDSTERAISGECKKDEIELEHPEDSYEEDIMICMICLDYEWDPDFDNRK